MTVSDVVEHTVTKCIENFNYFSWFSMRVNVFENQTPREYWFSVLCYVPDRTRPLYLLALEFIQLDDHIHFAICLTRHLIVLYMSFITNDSDVFASYYILDNRFLRSAFFTWRVICNPINLINIRNDWQFTVRKEQAPFNTSIECNCFLSDWNSRYHDIYHISVVFGKSHEKIK